MADENIIVRIQGESDLSKATTQLKELEARYEAAKKELDRLQQEELKYENAIKNQVKEQSKQAKALEENRKNYQRLKQEQEQIISTSKKSISTLKESVKVHNLLGNSSGAIRTQLRELREELMQMELAGDTSSRAFIDLSVKAAQLQDQFGDTQQQINILASDTRNLDAALSAGQGVTGAFTAATSAAALLGGESEMLEKAFLKVQAALSILNGVQQVANTLNKDSAARVVLKNAVETIREKGTKRQLALERLMNIQKATGVATDGAKITTTTLLTKAQLALNKAMAANPIGMLVALFLAAIAAVAFVTVGIVKLSQAFSKAGQAQREYNKMLKETEKLMTHVSIQNQAYAQAIVNNAKRIDDAYRKEINAAKARQASEVELLEIEKKHADERAELYSKVIPKALEEQKKAVIANEKAFKKAQEVLNNTSGERKRKKAMEQLKEAEEKYIQSQNEYIALQKERDDAVQAAVDAELALKEKLIDLENQLLQSEINLMKEGEKKEIAQINATYAEKLKAISGNSVEELALRTSLMAEQDKEIKAVQRKYALQEMEAELQIKKNALTADQTNYKLKEDLAKQEANYKIAQLDREALSTKQYAAQKKEIELQLAEDLKKIADERASKEAEIQSIITSTTLLAAQQRAGIEYSSEVYNVRKKQLEETAQAEIDAVTRSVMTEQEKAARIKEINQQLKNDLIALKKEQTSEEITITYEAINGELKSRANVAAEVLANKRSSLKEINAAEAEAKAARDGLLDSEEAELLERFRNQEINYQDYQNRLEEINHQRIMNEIADEESKFEKINETTTQVLTFVGDMASEIFGAVSDHINQQLEDIDNMYTTDAEEAKENANKKYISEKELENKKLALKRKAAAVEKASAMFSIGLNTAMAIMQAIAQFGPPPSPMGIAGIAMASALGITQLAIAAAKPLPQYAKGRKSGKGEYAVVGEKGPEVMYIPPGASIIPNSLIADPSTWGAFGVPEPKIPPVPDIPKNALEAAILTGAWGGLDYDRLGKAVARNIPPQKHVSVNIDRKGITIQDGAETHTYLNRKYQGAWS